MSFPPTSEQERERRGIRIGYVECREKGEIGYVERKEKHKTVIIMKKVQVL